MRQKTTKKNHGKATVSRGKDTLTCREVAAESGLGLQTVYDAIHRGELPHIKIGRRQIVSRPNYEAWLAGLGKTAP